MAEIKNKSFEEMLTELEKIVSKLEIGDIALEEALEMYKNGTLIARECSKLLEKAEKQIKILVNENGELTENDFSGNKE